MRGRKKVCTNNMTINEGDKSVEFCTNDCRVVSEAGTLAEIATELSFEIYSISRK